MTKNYSKFLIILFWLINYSFSSDAGYFLKTDSSENLIPLNEELNFLLKYKQKFTNPDRIALNGEQIKLSTETGITFDALFFDRDSKHVILLGQPFPGNKEVMLHHVELFEDYDILIFDYRWTNLLYHLLKPNTLIDPIKSLIFDEIEEIVTAIEFLRSKKDYTEIIGLGECYSNFLFIMAQAWADENNDKFFTKLILDSCWLSFEAFAESISYDPMLPISPAHGGCPEFIQQILKNYHVHFFLQLLIDAFVPRVDIEDYIIKMHDTPILFIHGIGDKMVPLKHFNRIWELIPDQNTEKVALFTPYQHCVNMWDKILYRKICDIFIKSNNIDEFLEKVT